MHLQGQEGLLSTYREPWRTRRAPAWLLAGGLFALYLSLYFTDVLDPVAGALGLPPSWRDGRGVGHGQKWYLYALVYTVAMIGGAAYYLRRHGNSRYNRARIAVNVAVQVVLAFAIPVALALMHRRDFYASYLWPLKIEYFYPKTILEFPFYVVVYSVVGSLVVLPALALTHGKRVYCSWICGCGGLANTFGDPWRHLSDRSTRAWRFEKVTVHATMGLAFVTTALVVLDFTFGPRLGALHDVAVALEGAYSFVVVSWLAGIIGVGVYPLLGPRVWCRYFCPMAAMLGLLQKAGRFRITVKPDMCISCGNCSTYCEMGIDVRAYAQANESFTRASCVGCGMCAHVCPRGVLKLENGSLETAPSRARLPVVRG